MAMTKNMIFGSMATAGVVALAAILDMAIKVPFGGYSLVMDILYLLAAGIVLYLGWDAYRDNK
ncbi:MAG: hypothetical protein EHM42_10190 [Planctomycetaceae bacterium]|nr:MAG: hypothetical protein EHM42_10190 [Planctomycetaceae bacterium]